MKIRCENLNQTQGYSDKFLLINDYVIQMRLNAPNKNNILL